MKKHPPDPVVAFLLALARREFASDTAKVVECKFDLGQVVITANARSTLSAEDVFSALCRHAAADWGELCEEDRRENERGLEEGNRLLSQYRAARDGRKFWIITEWDRSLTTVLLPEDY